MGTSNRIKTKLDGNVETPDGGFQPSLGRLKPVHGCSHEAILRSVQGFHWRRVTVRR